MTELVDDNGPITDTTRIYGKRNGTPSSFEATLLYDFIKARTDTLYPTQGQLSSLDDYVSAFTLQKNSSDNTKWDGQSLIARGFADGVEMDDLATVGQIVSLASALRVGTTVVLDGTDGRILYNNGGELGELQKSGTGKVLMDTDSVVASALTIGTQQTTQGSLVLANTAAGAYAVTLQSSNSTSAAWSLTLPTSAGSNGQALTTNGSGVTTWTTIVTAPGGSNGQMQYNSTSTFGGANLYVESANLIALRNSTNSQTLNIYSSYTDGSNYSRLAIAGNSITSQIAGTGSYTVTASAPVLDLAQSWNNAGVAFTGIKFNVPSDTSASASLLMDLQVGGSSKFKVDKADTT